MKTWVLEAYVETDEWREDRICGVFSSIAQAEIGRERLIAAGALERLNPGGWDCEPQWCGFIAWHIPGSDMPVAINGDMAFPRTSWRWRWDERPGRPADDEDDDE